MSPFTFAGYLPKEVPRAPEAMGLPGVERIASASQCFAKGPADGWGIHHNRLGLFDTPELARRVGATAENPALVLMAYAIAREAATEDGSVQLVLSDLRAAAPPPASYVTLGYDAVSASHGCGFECSPLTCNGGAKTFAANRWGLFDDPEQAAAAAAAFATGPWEPGPYWVVEVMVPAGWGEEA